MKTIYTVLCVGLVLGLTSLRKTDPPCSCDIQIVTSGIDTIVPELLLAAYRLVGDDITKRQFERYRSATEFHRPMKLDTTRTWFTEHSPCGTDKVCVKRVIVKRAPDNTHNWVVMEIEMEARQ